jgi:phosphoribosyl-ATP pyrophosphohydrolase
VFFAIMKKGIRKIKNKMKERIQEVRIAKTHGSTGSP